MSEVYPLMRGTAPLLVAIVSVAVLSEPLAPLAWLGQLDLRRRSQHGRRPACGAPAAYTLWIFLLTGVPLAVWACATRGRAFRRYVGGNWRLGVVGGIGATASYGLALWAMTVAPVAVVTALRETSILFGTAVSGVILKESVGMPRVAGAFIIVIGAITLRLA